MIEISAIRKGLLQVISGHTHQSVSEAGLMSATSSRKYYRIFLDHRLTPRDLQTKADEELEKIFLRPRQEVLQFAIPNWELVAEETARKKNRKTIKVCWEEYAAQVPADLKAMTYKSFCKAFKAYKLHMPKDVREMVLRFDWPAGEAVMIDYSGDTVPYVDIVTGEIRQAQVFVGVLAHSMYIFCTATARQTTDDWVDAVIAMYKFFGGCAHTIIVDNPKPLVTTVHPVSTVFQKLFLRCCEHYGSTPLAARPGAPRDKGAVEGAVHLVQERVLSKMMKTQYMGLDAVKADMTVHLEDLNNRPFVERRELTRAEAFEEERPFLKPLPKVEFEPSSDAKVLSVRNDYQVRFNNKRLSVPHEYVGKKVRVVHYPRQGHYVIYNLVTGERITEHYAEQGRRTYVKREHMPKAHAVMVKTREEHLADLEQIGPNVYKLAQRITERLSYTVARTRLSALAGIVTADCAEYYETCARETLKMAEPSLQAFIDHVGQGHEERDRRMKVAKTRKKKVREAVNENLRGSQHYAQQLREAANAE